MVALRGPRRATRSRDRRARGTVGHERFGLGALPELSLPDAGTRWTPRFGAILERLEASEFEVACTLVDGAGAGTNGVLDHLSDVTFATPCLGAQRLSPLGAHRQLAGRFLAGAPLPPGHFDGRLTGPGPAGGGASRHSRRDRLADHSAPACRFLSEPGEQIGLTVPSAIHEAENPVVLL